MKHMTCLAIMLALGLGGACTQAQTLDEWLPPSAQVAAVLQMSPSVQAARHKQEAQLIRASATESGSGEWTLRLSQQQRRVHNPQERFAESAIAFERPVRMWGKSEMDARLAAQDREVARIGLADAMHEASRQLLVQWFGALRARQSLDDAQRALELAKVLDRLARVRLNVGEIPALDARLASAELQRNEANVQLLQSEWDRSAVQLQRLYPGLSEPRLPASGTGEPMLGGAGLESALHDFLDRNHELKLLRAESMRQQQLAKRVERDRYPDPVVGVFTARERAGAEQLVGFSVSIPLSGGYRAAQAQAALADADMLQERVKDLERNLSADFESRWLQLKHQQQALKTLQAASAAQRQAAEKSFTAYAQGEHSMTELVQNRKAANEQEAASQRLRIECVFTRAMIELDAHRLWDLDD